ncbi:PAS domain-containing protein [Pedobacter sp. ASV28]|uniref:sensor histidine kinase n=1 Tax=Pedobacter sp. ASV28 TaxID=2795123 RepID=UPI0018EBA75D|nr:PAS domain-containing protein [Pedobacter sp. ASV28]
MKSLKDSINFEVIAQTAENFEIESSMIFKIADAVPDMLYLTDVRCMRIIYSNTRIQSLFNMTQKKIADMGAYFFEKIVHPEDKDKYFESIANLKYAADEDIEEVKYRIIDYQGKVHWLVSKQKVFKRDEEGIPVQIIGISQNITDQVILEEEKNNLLEEKLKLKANQQREILKAIMHAQENERSHIAEALHNEVGQLLFAAQLNLGSAEKESSELLNRAIQKVRQISFELTPILLNDMGLEIALADMLKKKLKPLNIAFKFSFDLKVERLNRNLEIIIYRMIQELLNNSIKYADATLINVLVLQKNDQLYISQTDNGKGMESKAWSEALNGFGLKNIANRIDILNGVFDVFTAPNKGTKVLINIPLHDFSD